MITINGNYFIFEWYYNFGVTEVNAGCLSVGPSGLSAHVYRLNKNVSILINHWYFGKIRWCESPKMTLNVRL